MARLKKDISSGTYLQFVNNIWKTTPACCNCKIRNGECADIAKKGKCNAFNSKINDAEVLVFKNESFEMDEPKEFVRDYHMEKDIISIAKGNFDQEKYPGSLDAYKAYYKKHYGGMKEEVLTYGFFLQLFLKPTAEYVLKQTGDWEHFLQAIFEQSLTERYRLQTAEKPAFEERLFLRIESWLCTLQVRERDENGKLKWIVDLKGHQHVDI